MIGRDTIDRIRSRVDIVAIVSESVKLSQRGRSHVGLCPFHQEKTGSFSVSADRQLFYCFGCKVSGDVFKFLELNEGLSFIETVKRLAERAGVEIVDERSDRDRVAEDRAKKAKDDLFAANAAASAYFEKMLVDHPLGKIARDELERRGLVYDGDMKPVLQSFGIGYAPHGWDGLAQYFRTCDVSPAVAEQVGLLAPRSGGSGYYDAFRHRLLVAIKDVQGRIVAFSGRALPDPPGTTADAAKDRDRGPPPKYVNSRESPIYSKGHTLFGLFQARNGIRAQSEAVIVEGNFDLVAMHARGIDHVVAPLGTAFTPDQARLLRRFAPAVVLLFDADAAGRKATWAARETCKAAELGVRAARLSEGKDPDEFLQAKGADAMKRALHSARSLDEVLVEDVCEPVGEHSNLAAKQAALHKIRPILEEQPPALREPLAKLAAKRLGIDLEALWRLVRAAHAPSDLQAAANATASPASRESSEEDRLSRAIVEELLGCPELLEDVETQEALSMVTGDWAFAVVAMRDEMRAARQENRPFDGGSLLARLPPSIQDVAAAKLADPSVEGAYSNIDPASRRLFASAAQENGDPMIVRHKILDDARKLAKAVTKARYEEILQRIKRAESSGDDALADALIAEKVRLLKELREVEARIRAAAA